jgi:hypothetical protein
MDDPRAGKHRAQVAEHLGRTATFLASLQGEGALRGNVSPWRSTPYPDFHGTLQAIWVWARHAELTRDETHLPRIEAAWAFIDDQFARYVPVVLGPQAPYEAGYDCASVLLAAIADQRLFQDDQHRSRALQASEVLATYLEGLRESPGREFRDPGWMAYNLAEYGRLQEDPALVDAARVYVERCYPTKFPSFVDEPNQDDVMFDFLSTQATRTMATVSALGHIPYTGAWLRERVLGAAPKAFVGRVRDEHAWNATVAAALGAAYRVSHDAGFLDGYFAILNELKRRDQAHACAMARDSNYPEFESGPTFFWAFAMDALW